MSAAATDSRTESLAELCTIVDQHKARYRPRESGNLFTENELAPVVTPDLSATFLHMQAAGYVIGNAVRLSKSTRHHHTEWHVQITRGRFQCTLAFLVPEDVS